jgi:hypothetical protein
MNRKNNNKCMRKGFTMNKRKEENMRERICIIFLMVTLAIGTSQWIKTLPLGLSDAHAAHPTTPTGFTNSFMLDSCGGFSSTGSNPYFILEIGYQLVLEGLQNDKIINLTIDVLNETQLITDPEAGLVETRVVRETETKNGKLVEISRNYFAICNRTNSVVYFGEDVDIYDKTGTEVVGHEGAWRAGQPAGELQARAGIIMPGDALIGAKYYQEVAPEVAKDRAQIISKTEIVKTPIGDLTDCLGIKETTPLEPDVVGYKFYAPTIGLIKDGPLKLKSYLIP